MAIEKAIAEHELHESARIRLGGNVIKKNSMACLVLLVQHLQHDVNVCARVQAPGTAILTMLGPQWGQASR